MDLLYHYVIPFLWLACSVYWLLSASKVKATAREESIASRSAHLVPMTVAILLLFAPRSLPWGVLGERMFPGGPATHWIGAAVVAAGLAFAVWARTHLGKNWSGTVTLKSDHELIRSGPYHFVRHPIYSGGLLAMAGTVVARGEWRGLLAVLIMFAVVWRKLQHEERWMGEAFGEDYAKYRSEVYALIPFVL
ncbi:MAG: isoprenylcysteine carboxylmethyltransferase family protein [Pseudomonadota bacterium]